MRRRLKHHSIRILEAEEESLDREEKRQRRDGDGRKGWDALLHE